MLFLNVQCIKEKTNERRKKETTVEPKVFYAEKLKTKKKKKTKILKKNPELSKQIFRKEKK